jgi:formylglycine-generating enzyme required for sulfatase activity
MALVPAGCFPMGSNDGDFDEQPVHQICFDTPFWIDVTEVTNGQFAALSGQAERSSNWTDADRPRETVTWVEADAFCRLRGARLPTEAEWEYAAREPDGLVYPWGNT